MGSPVRSRNVYLGPWRVSGACVWLGGRTKEQLLHCWLSWSRKGLGWEGFTTGESEEADDGQTRNGLLATGGVWTLCKSNDELNKRPRVKHQGRND